MSTRPAPRPGLPATAGEGPALGPGRKLGRYELRGLIAAGGMAEVWVAEQTGDLGFKKLVALKTIRPEYAFDATFRAMFLDEARLASRIRHANVVEVLDLGVDGNVVFQVMTLVEGTSLSGWIKKVADRGLARGAALRVVIDALRGLEAAHDLVDDDGAPLGLVHRDVSPQNVLVGTDGIAKLADFGIAKAFGRGAPKETLGGEVKGKLGYVAPEIFLGLPASPQSDIFSAGVILWECLTRERLFPVASGETKRKTHVARDPRELVADLPTRLAEIAMAALHVDPFKRTANATEMADALESTGLAASHKDVALKLAADLGDALLLGRRGATEKPNDPGRTETVAIVATMPLLDAPERPSVPPPRGTNRGWWIGAAIVSAVALAIVGVRTIGTSEVPAPVAATSGSTPPAPPPSSETPRDDRSAALDLLDAGAAKVAPTPATAKSGLGRRRGNPVPTGTSVVAPVTSGPQPTFGSPY